MITPPDVLDLSTFRPILPWYLLDAYGVEIPMDARVYRIHLTTGRVDYYTTFSRLVRDETGRENFPSSHVFYHPPLRFVNGDGHTYLGEPR